MSRRSKSTVTDVVDGTETFGIHDRAIFSYSGNRIASAFIEGRGADYAGRTGFGSGRMLFTGFKYDGNGNMTADPSRGISSIEYDRFDRPTVVTFADGHRQSIAYDGFGRRRRVEYAQAPAAVVAGGSAPDDDDYAVYSVREYVGPHVFVDGVRVMSSFDGGYFDADGEVRYMLTDRLGNVAAVVGPDGTSVQSARYYPYGEPVREPDGQPFLFASMERERAGGRNVSLFPARPYHPASARWTQPDKLRWKYPSVSPYAYCAGDPVNFIDPDGEEILCISSDPDIVEFSKNMEDNGDLIICSHGNNFELQDSRDGKDVRIKDSNGLINLLNNDFNSIDNVNSMESVTIHLHACKTGQNTTSGEIPVAQKFSKGIQNAFIIAPNGYVVMTPSLGIDEIYNIDENGNRTPVTNAPWRVFFRGNEIQFDEISNYKKLLRKEREYNSLLPKILLDTTLARPPNKL